MNVFMVLESWDESILWEKGHFLLEKTTTPPKNPQEAEENPKQNKTKTLTKKPKQTKPVKQLGFWLILQ